MNKRQYLAELSNLLAFMTSEDRSEVLHYYGDRFDSAGEENSQHVISELGTPTFAAITLSRAYQHGDKIWKDNSEASSTDSEEDSEAAAGISISEEGQSDTAGEDTVTQVAEEQAESASEPDMPEEETASDEPTDAPQTADMSESVPEIAEPAADETDLDEAVFAAAEDDSEEIGEIQEAHAAAPEEPTDAAAFEKLPQTEAPEESAFDALPEERVCSVFEEKQNEADAPDADAGENVSEPEIPSAEITDSEDGRLFADLAPEEETVASGPSGFKKFLRTAFYIIPGAPMAIIAAAVSVLLAVPGAVLCFAAYLTAIGGIWCLGFLADALLIFGLAAVLLAFGIVLLWLGVWAAIQLWKWLIGWLGSCGERILFGRSEAE